MQHVVLQKDKYCQSDVYLHSLLSILYTHTAQHVSDARNSISFNWVFYARWVFYYTHLAIVCMLFGSCITWYNTVFILVCILIISDWTNDDCGDGFLIILSLYWSIGTMCSACYLFVYRFCVVVVANQKKMEHRLQNLEKVCADALKRLEEAEDAAKKEEGEHSLLSFFCTNVNNRLFCTQFIKHVLYGLKINKRTIMMYWILVANRLDVFVNPENYYLARCC